MTNKQKRYECQAILANVERDLNKVMKLAPLVDINLRKRIETLSEALYGVQHVITDSLVEEIIQKRPKKHLKSLR